jgi:hypothetical protein
MDPFAVQLLVQILIGVLVVFSILRGFYRTFVKPLLPNPPAGNEARPASDIRGFLDNLRRDLGHGEAPAREGGLLDQNSEAAAGQPDSAREDAPSAATPPRRTRLEQRRTEQPPPGYPVPGRPAEPSAERLQRRPVRAPAASTEGVQGEIRKVRAALGAAAARAQERAAADRPAEEGEWAVAPEGEPGHIFGTDLATAMQIKEIFGPPRAFRPFLRGGSLSRRAFS